MAFDFESSSLQAVFGNPEYHPFFEKFLWKYAATGKTSMTTPEVAAMAGLSESTTAVLVAKLTTSVEAHVFSFPPEDAEKLFQAYQQWSKTYNVLTHNSTTHTQLPVGLVNEIANVVSAVVVSRLDEEYGLRELCESLRELQEEPLGCKSRACGD